MADYVAVLSKDETSDYGVDFPDFPGCVTAGETPEEAKRMASEALLLHLEGMAEEGEPIPAPRSLDSIRDDPALRDALDLFLVNVPDEVLSVSNVKRSDASATCHAASDPRL
jgi:predicted RNase H-like HicB family nuclease